MINKTKKLVYQSKSMHDLMSRILRVAKSDLSVLLTGESGTGKNMIAETVHDMSSRSGQVFRKIDCATLTENLIDNELFGHESEAFTGAAKRTRGRFELSNRGTVFLDHIDCLTGNLQAKLLGVIEDGCFVRLGGNEEIKVDIRLIVATNKNLKELLRNKLFLWDLYYRINGVSFNIPPLRNRIEDIPILVDYMLGLHQKITGDRKKMRIDTLDILRNYCWPGNVRELENVIFSSCVLSDGLEIQPLHLPQEILNNALISTSVDIREPKPLEVVCAKYSKTVLAHVGDDKGLACKYLGISYPTLKKYLDLIDRNHHVM